MFLNLPPYVRNTPFSLAEAILQTTSSSSSISIDAESRLVVIHVVHDEIASRRVYNRGTANDPPDSRAHRAVRATHSSSTVSAIRHSLRPHSTRTSHTSARFLRIYTYVYKTPFDRRGATATTSPPPTLLCGSTWIYDLREFRSRVVKCHRIVNRDRWHWKILDRGKMTHVRNFT